MKVLGTFKQQITISLDGEHERDACRLLNIHFFNDEQCNKIEGGKMVAKYPEIEAANPEIKEAYYAVRRSRLVDIEIELLENGSIRMKK